MSAGLEAGRLEARTGTEAQGVPPESVVPSTSHICVERKGRPLLTLVRMSKDAKLLHVVPWGGEGSAMASMGGGAPGKRREAVAREKSVL